MGQDSYWVTDVTGKVVYDGARSEAEAARWWLEHGRRGDRIGLGEAMCEVVDDVLPDESWSYNENGEVVQ